MKHLAEVKVAVNAGTYGPDLVIQHRPEPAEKFLLQAEHSRCLLTDKFRNGVMLISHQLKDLAGQVAHRLVQ